MTIPKWTLADRLTKAREHANLTQHELAERLGVGDKTVWRAEKGSPGTQRTTILAWAVACGVDHTWLLTGEEGGDADTQAVTLCTPRDCPTVCVPQLPGQLSLKVAA